MPENNHIAQLIIKHLQETITADEANTLQAWIDATDKNRDTFNRLVNSDNLQSELLAHTESDQRIQDQVYTQLPEVQDALVVPMEAPVKGMWMRWTAVAAAAIILISTGTWYWWQGRSGKKEVATVQKTPTPIPIPPGGNKATLTLADGTVLDLNKTANGAIATQGKTTVNKREDGQLEYKTAIGSRVPIATGTAITYNVLSTPRGGQYQLILPDQSKVWLNASSSIRYPTAFASNERRVEISGEAYFEVAKDAQKPFRVSIHPPTGGTEGGLVEVLGTHFNINAYGDEQPVVTTLLEGRVMISANSETETQSGASNVKNRKPETGNRKLLLPGEEAQINDKAAITVKKNVDTESAVAWMKGFFDFKNAGIKSVMKQVSRWYNVDIEYTGAVPSQSFEGNIDRNIPLNDLLSFLQQMGSAKFQLEGRTIKVK